MGFKQYTGAKTVKATRMGAGEALRAGAQITENTVLNNIGNDGYLVEYPDGYRSWSPKKVFEEAYMISETHIDRMKIELYELNERICKATKAIYTIDAIPSSHDRDMVCRQVKAMREYASILYDRIRNADTLRDCVAAVTSQSKTKKGGI
ncbi:MAG: hypothetical protein HDR97_00475 [Bacteroides sp.]|nr:hypothetical protein [Bacteroides sp.]